MNLKLNRKREKRMNVMMVIVTLVLSVIILVPSIFAINKIYAATTKYIGELVNDTSKGYIKATFTYGSFPQSKVTDSSLISELNAQTKNDDGTLTYNGNNYLYELDNSGNGYWYLFEPIKWQVLKYDYTTNIIAISECCLESRTFDTQASTQLLWDGTNQTSTAAYPALRLYLNSYYSDHSYTYDSSNQVESVTTLPLTKAYTAATSGTSFYDKGFREKAFMYETNNYTQYWSHDKILTNVDGTNNSCDWVRLLSISELSTSDSSNSIPKYYGFINSTAADSSRLGYVTDYSKSKATSVGTTLYNGRYTQSWWTMSRNAKPMALCISETGSQTTNVISNYVGVRPVITIPSAYISSLQLEAVPRDSNSTFSYWSYNGTKTSTNATYENTISPSDLTSYIANFKHNLTAYVYDPSDGSSYDVTLSKEEVDYGDTVTITASLDDLSYYEFNKIKWYGKKASDTSYTLLDLEFIDSDEPSDDNGYYTFTYNYNEDYEIKGVVPTILSTGKTVNKNLKKLVNSSATYETIDNSIKEIIFTNDIDDKPTSDYVNLAYFGEALAYVSDSTNGIIKIYSEGTIYTHSDSSYLFSDLRSLEELDLSNLDTSLTTNMLKMFYCDSITELTLGDNFDTSNVTDMSYMFDCNQFEIIDLGNKFDTSKVTNMSSMFSGCGILTELELGDKFDTSNVINMDHMFFQCKELSSLDLGDNFNTSNVTNMAYMFGSMSSMYELDLGDKFDTSKVTSMYGMFDGCNALYTLDLGDKFNTSKVTNMINMFNACYAMTSLDLGDNFDTSKITSMNQMFSHMFKLTSLDLGDKFDTSNVTIMMYAFYDMPLLTSLDLGEKFYTNKVTTMQSMFQGDASLTTLNIQSKIDSISDATNKANYFNTSSVTNMKYMFYGCSGLTTLKLGENFNTSKVTTMYMMFQDTKNLSSLDISMFDSSLLKETTNMFNNFGYNVTGTVEIDLGCNFSCSGVTNAEGMFKNTGYKASEVSVNVGDLYMTSVTTVKDMFNGYGHGCTNLSLDLSNFKILDETTCTNFLVNSGVTEIILPIYYVSSDAALPTKTGYSWIGFTNANVSINEVYTNLVKNGTTTGLYKIKLMSNKTLTLSTNPNDATIIAIDTSKSQYGSLAYGSSAKAVATLVNSNYKFKGWYKASDTSYTSAVSTNSTYSFTITEDTSLVAVAEAKTYQVAYDGNGQTSGTMSNSTHTCGVAKTLNANAYSKTGYTFSGWSSTKGGTKAYDDKASVTNLSTTDEDTVTLYAVWTANAITVTFDGNGGTSSETSRSVTYDSAYGTMPTATRAGYTLSGWYTAKTSGTKVESTTKVTNASSHTLYAIWTANTYQVAYDGNGQTSGTMSNSTHTYGLASALTANAYSKTGYKFLGWSTSKGGTKAYDDKASVTTLATSGTVTLYAVWQLNTLNLTFDGNGGTASETSRTLNYGDAYGTMPTASKTGYTLSGWFTLASGGTEVTSTTTVSQTGSQTLYAHYTANSITVTFDGNGGTPTSQTKSVTYDSTYGTLPSVTKTGYTFSGWYTAKTSGTKIESTTKVANASAHTLYAIWEADTITVTFDANSGECLTKSKTVTYDSAYGTLPEPTKAGYTFDGWYTVKTSGSKVIETTKVTNASSHTLYAIWTANTYAVTFNANEGTCDTSSKDVTYDSTYGDLPTATKEGYTFEGWYTDITSGTEITSDTKVAITAAQTLYAHYSVIKYNLEVNYDSSKINYTGTPSGSYDYGTSIDISFSAKTGYKNAAADNSITSMPSHDVEVNITADPITYNVDYNGNGSTNLIGMNSPHIYDQEQKLIKNSYVKTGHTFLGWSEDKDATTATYTDEQLVKNLTSIDGATVRLYAVWSAETYNLTYDANGGTCEYVSQPITYGKAYGTLIGASKAGYTFDGWYTEKSGGDKIESTSIVSVTSDQELHAHWTVNKYNLIITYDSNIIDYTGTPSGSYDYGTELSITYSAKTGYKDASDDCAVTVMPDSDLTVNITASPITYVVKYDGNGSANAAMANSTHTYNEDKALSKNTYVREGYTFLGWSENSEATIATYTDEQLVKNLTTTDGDTVTLYAVWSINDYTLTFDANGGECSETSRTLNYNEAYGELPSATKEGYLFANWHTKDGSTFKDKVTKDTLMTSSSQTVYARWISVSLPSSVEYSTSSYTVTPEVKYTDNNGIVPSSYYTVTSSSGSLSLSDVGLYTITITGDGTNAVGTITKTIEITKKSLGTNITVDDSALIYNGKEQTPVITIKDGDVTLTENKDYTLKYSNNINAGTNSASVKITPIGNYSGSEVTKTFSIQKRELDINDFKLYNGENEVTSSNLVTKERDITNSKDITSEYVLSLRYTYENLPFSEVVKLTGDFKYSQGEPDGNINSGFNPIDINASNLVLDSSVSNNYKIKDNKTEKTISNLGKIVDTISPKVVSIERNTGDTYGSGQTMRFVITVDEDLVYDAGSEIKLILASENGTAFKNSYATLTSKTAREMIFEYTVDKEDNGKNGKMQISLSITGEVSDKYENMLDNTIQTFVNELNDITINTDGFNVPVTCNPSILDTEVTNSDTVTFTYDLTGITLLSTLTKEDVINGIKVYVDDTEITTIKAVQDSLDTNKYIVTVNTSDYITSDNDEGITITSKLLAGSIQDSMNNDNLEASKSIKVVRKLNSDDIVVTFKGNELEHGAENVQAVSGDEVTFSLKDSVIEGVKLAYNTVTNVTAPVTETITSALNEFKNIFISKTGWSNSDAFDITFHVRNLEDVVSDINTIYSDTSQSSYVIKYKNIGSKHLYVDSDRTLIGLSSSNDTFVKENYEYVAYRLYEVMENITLTSSNIKEEIEKIIQEMKDVDTYQTTINAASLNDTNIEDRMIKYELFPQSMKDYLNSDETKKSKVSILKKKYKELLESKNYSNSQTVTSGDESTKFEAYGLINYVDNTSEEPITLKINPLETVDSVEKDYEYVYAEINNDASLSGYSPMVPYEIGLYQGDSKLSNSKIDNSGEGILIKLTLPENYYTSDVKIVHVKDDNTSEVLPTKHKTLEIVNDVTYCNVYFYTTSFSDFILLTDKKIVTVHEIGEGGNVTSDKNIDYSNVTDISVDITLEPKTKATIKVIIGDNEVIAIRDELVNDTDTDKDVTYNKFTNTYINEIPTQDKKVIIYVIYSSVESQTKVKDKKEKINEEETDEEVQTILDTLDHESYMTGYTNNTFRPNNKLTRGEVAAILSRTSASYSDEIDYSSFVKGFKDLSDSSWCENYLGFAKSKDYIKGYGNGTIKANNYITRGEMATILCRYLGLKTVSSSYSKTNDTKGKWYESYANTLMYYGYMTGTSNSKFDGEKYITRAEAVTVINRCLNRDLKQSLTEEEQEDFESRFTDVKNKWYYYDVYEATTSYSSQD